MSDKKTERIKWKKADGREALTAILKRLVTDDPVIMVRVLADGTRVKITGQAYVEGGFAFVGEYAIDTPSLTSITVDVAQLEPPLFAWADCQVVRDGEGRLWAAHGSSWCTPGWTPRIAETLAMHFGPITPVIDADGRPILSEDALDRAALTATRKQYGLYGASDEEVRKHSLYDSVCAALRETLGGAR